MWRRNCFCHFIKICWILLSLRFRFVISWKDEWKISNAISDWYQPWEQCVFHDLNEDISPIDLLMKCQEKYGVDRLNYTDYKCRIGGERFQYSCALDGPPLTPNYHSRPYLMKSYHGYDNPHQHYLRDFMLQLLRLNGNLLIFGDSQMQSLCRAMTCELLRTNNTNDPPQERPTSAQFNSSLVSIKCLNHNNLLDIDHDLQFVRNSIEETFTQSGFNYTFIIINIGTHYNDQSDEIHHHKNSRYHFQQHLMKLLPMLEQLSFQYPYPPPPSAASAASGSHSLHISWLETPLQHYNTSNGYYNGTLTNCVPLQDISLHSDWRNYDLYSLLSRLNITSLSIIPLRDMMIPLYREHHRGNGVDCTHYCYWPMLYQSVYKRMLEILQRHTQQNNYHHGHNNKKNKNISFKSPSQPPPPPPLPPLQNQNQN